MDGECVVLDGNVGVCHARGVVQKQQEGWPFGGKSACRCGIRLAGERAMQCHVSTAPCLSLPCSVRWHMASVGSETDMHSLHLHGNTWLK